MLPGYNGRNKTFFLVNYEGTRIDRGATSFYTVPTPQQLTGRFDTTIIDPLTGQPFPNNTIPQSRFSRLAQLAIRDNWFPAPNSTAAQGNFQDVRTFPQTQDQFTDPRRPGSGQARTGVRPLHGHQLRRTRRART